MVEFGVKNEESETGSGMGDVLVEFGAKEEEEEREGVGGLIEVGAEGGVSHQCRKMSTAKQMRHYLLSPIPLHLPQKFLPPIFSLLSSSSPHSALPIPSLLNDCPKGG